MKMKFITKVLSFVTMFTLFFSLGGIAQAVVTPSTDPNPQLNKTCGAGMKIVLILDSSDSMSGNDAGTTGDLKTAKDAAKNLVNSLMPVNPMGVIDFDTNVISSLSPTTNQSAVISAINNVGHTSSREFTNWDAAFKTADSMVGSGDLVVIITDGNPNKYLVGNTVTPSGNDMDETAAVNAAINSANAIKSGGTRILAIGINSSGTNVGLNQNNLKKISGSQVVSGSFTDINAVDVYTGDISTLSSVLTSLTTSLCGGTINVSKVIDGDESFSQFLSDGFDFTIADQPVTTNEVGSASVKVNSTGPWSVTETLGSDYSFVGASCTINGNPLATTTITNGVSGITLTNTGTDVVNCTFHNSPNFGILNVIKHVVNDDKTADNIASDFTMNVKDIETDEIIDSFSGSESGTVVKVNDGVSYSVYEGDHSGYDMSSEGDCRGDMIKGDVKTCTITNDDLTTKIDPVLSVTNSPVTYNGSNQAADVSSSVPGELSNIRYDGSIIAPVNAGTYAVTADFVPTDTENYNSLIGASAGDFVIEKADALITVTPYSVSYDGSSHTASGEATGVLSESLSGLDLSTTTHTDAGDYTGDAWTFTDTTGNYNDTLGTVDDVIGVADITVTADAKAKNFGDDDPALTYSVTEGSLFGTDSFEGSLTRDSGEDVGTYAINQGTLSLNSNYNLSYEGDYLTIGQNTITVTADPQTKVYGTSNPDLTYQFSPALEDGDSFEGVLDLASGENVGLHAITQGTLTLSDNYIISFTGNNLEITPAELTVTADAKSKKYGELDPALTYEVEGLIGSDTLSGSLTRDLGEDVGIYAITIGDLKNDNYNINYTGADLTIEKADQTINFPELTDKTYGDEDFSPGASASSGLPISYVSETEEVCTVIDSVVHIIGVGTCTITAKQSGNDNYNAAEDVSQSFTVATSTHNIVASAGSGGSISPLGTVTVAEGNDQGFIIKANRGFHITKVLVDGSSIGAMTSYNFSKVKANHTISATFTRNSSGGGGGGSYVYQCSDGLDNDGDGLSDINDPGCYSDGNVNNPNSYDRLDNDETNGQVLGAETTCGIYVDKYVRRGYKNDVVTVKKIQTFLNDYMTSGLVVDGIFGPKTEAALKAFQVKHADKILTPWNLTAPTGIFYLTTQTEVNNIMCPALNLPIPSDLIPFANNPAVPAKV